jgi:nucleoside-diphosphate-sugar epimerase
LAPPSPPQSFCRCVGCTFVENPSGETIFPESDIWAHRQFSTQDKIGRMKVFVAGGTGAIGGQAVPALVRAGHQVTALARTPEKAALLSRRGATPIMVSIFDRVALKDAFMEHQAIVNLATAIPPTSKFMQTKAWADNDRLRTEGAAAVVDAAIEAGVSRVVQESVSMLYRERHDVWIDEDSPTDNFPMARANHAAEASANRFSLAGGVGVVLRFGWFYGPGARHSEEFLALARRRICVMMGPPDTYVSSVHVADGGAAVAAALTVPAGTYNIVDDEPLTKRAYADALAAAAGKRVCVRVPGRLALLLGDRSTSLTRSLRVSNARFREASGWAPIYPSAREGWIAIAKALEQVSRGNPIPEH